MTIDTLTGEYQVDRADVLEDVGRSLNPAIDIGQVEGGFIQGVGWLTTEELWWDDKGQLRTHAPSTYKIPVASDVPPHLQRQAGRVEHQQGAGDRPLQGRRRAAAGAGLLGGRGAVDGGGVGGGLQDRAEARHAGNAGARAAGGGADAEGRGLSCVLETYPPPCPSPQGGGTLQHRARARQSARPSPLRGGTGWGYVPMTLTALRTFIAAHPAAILAELAAVRGSSPREAGAFMLIAADAQIGTIGGGALEYMVIDRARQVLRDGGDGDSLDIPLGPEIGQCCGGRVDVSLRRLTPAIARGPHRAARGRDRRPAACLSLRRRPCRPCAGAGAGAAAAQRACRRHPAGRARRPARQRRGPCRRAARGGGARRARRQLLRHPHARPRARFPHRRRGAAARAMRPMSAWSARRRSGRASAPGTGPSTTRSSGSGGWCCRSAAPPIPKQLGTSGRRSLRL